MENYNDVFQLLESVNVNDEVDLNRKGIEKIPWDRLLTLGTGAALALRMREALYYGDWQVAKAKAQAIMDLGQYSLER